MARYLVRNLTQGRIIVPHPVNRPIDREQSIIVTAPAHLMEQFNYNFRKKHVSEQLKSGLISVESLPDTDTPEVLQVTTLQVVQDLLAGFSSTAYYFGQQIYSGPDIPSGSVVPGVNFFDFTTSGLIFYNSNAKLQNCRVFLNGVAQVNGNSLTINDVRLGPSPSLGDLVFTNPSTIIRTGDVISVEAVLG